MKRSRHPKPPLPHPRYSFISIPYRPNIMIFTGQTFASFEYLKRALQEWSIAEKFSTKTTCGLLRHAHGQLVNYQAALHCRNTLANAGAAAHAYQFFYLPAYIDALEQQSPYCYTNLTTLPSPSNVNPTNAYFDVCLYSQQSHSVHSPSHASLLLWTVHILKDSSSKRCF